MSYNECPVCGERSQLRRLRRGFLERHITRANWHKYRCRECDAVLFQHQEELERIEAIDEPK
ncbi:hypothetical protein [Ferrimonas senticii]|uniref:hypothetical protein n=1 Tax=Ferrimonas senticii TaxID=394566 RepID=UPI000408F738|nr:hypothetical protein [Ferrimonas senticii]